MFNNPMYNYFNSTSQSSPSYGRIGMSSGGLSPSGKNSQASQMPQHQSMSNTGSGGFLSNGMNQSSGFSGGGFSPMAGSMQQSQPQNFGGGQMLAMQGAPQQQTFTPQQSQQNFGGGSLYSMHGINPPAQPQAPQGQPSQQTQNMASMLNSYKPQTAQQQQPRPAVMPQQPRPQQTGTPSFNSLFGGS